MSGAHRATQIMAEVLTRQRLQGGTLPQLLCEACLRALPVDGVGMALFSAAGPVGMVGASGDHAEAMEDLQLVTGEGPCMDASAQRRPVLQPHLRQTGPERWLGFGPAALGAGVEAIFAFPLQVGEARLGVLDLYRTTAGSLDEGELAEALSFADAAVVILLHLQEQTPLDMTLHPDLMDVSGRQSQVHQATGMISVQAGVGLADALLLLRGRAFATGRAVVDVAADVLSHALRFQTEIGDDE